MSYKGEIPGMYWDESAGRYFSVNRFAAAEAKYSSHDIKRRKLNDKRKADIAEEEVRQKGRIRRSTLDPLTSGLLAREHGTRRLDSSSIFAQALSPQAHLPTAGDPYAYIFAALPRPDVGPSINDLLTFGEHEMGTTRIGEDFHYRIEEWLSGNPTSISIHETAQRIALTHRSSSPHSGIVIAHSNFLDFEDSDDSVAQLYVGPGRSRGAEVEILSSTAAPQSSSILFAIGTSNGIMTIGKQNVDDARFLRCNVSEDVFALEFVSGNPSLLMSGGRNGFLDMTDLRTPTSGRQSDNIAHKSSITHIKSLDPHRLLVAGLRSSLCQYDLRFRKGPKRTQCILQYPEYHNTATIVNGFDVDVESGVIAAAQEHDLLHAPVQLFSLHGGQKLDSKVSGVALKEGNTDFGNYPTGNYRFRRTAPHKFLQHNFSSAQCAKRPIERGEVIPCIKFVRDVESGPKSLYIGADEVTRWGWASKESEA